MWDLHLNKSGIKSNKEIKTNPASCTQLRFQRVQTQGMRRGLGGTTQEMERLGHPQVSLCLQRPSWGLKGRVSAFAQNLHGQGASDFKPSICFHGNMLASPRSSSVSFLDSSCAHAGTCTHPECRHTPTPTGIPNSTASSLGTTLLGHKDVLYLHVQSHWVPFRKKKRP